MANLDELKATLSEKEIEFRNFSDSILLRGVSTEEDETKRQLMKEELQSIKDEIIKLEPSHVEEDWETEAESNNIGVE